MTAIDRTAYPRPGTRLTREELTARYELSDADLAFIRANSRGKSGRLMLATLLKTRQGLGFFTMPEEVHPEPVTHLASQLGLTTPPASGAEGRRTKSLYRYRRRFEITFSFANTTKWPNAWWPTPNLRRLKR